MPQTRDAQTLIIMRLPDDELHYAPILKAAFHQQLQQEGK